MFYSKLVWNLEQKERGGRGRGDGERESEMFIYIYIYREKHREAERQRDRERVSSGPELAPFSSNDVRNYIYASRNYSICLASSTLTIAASFFKFSN